MLYSATSGGGIGEKPIPSKLESSTIWPLSKKGCNLGFVGLTAFFAGIPASDEFAGAVDDVGSIIVQSCEVGEGFGARAIVRRIERPDARAA